MLLKRIYTISLLIIIGFSQAGYHIFSAGYRAYLQEEMREQLLHKADRHNLICIDYTAHAKEIKWEKENEEFTFGEKMYDVAYADTVGRKILLYCADDEREARLLAQQKEKEKQNHSGEKKSPVRSMKISDFFRDEDHIIIYSSKLPRPEHGMISITLTEGKKEIIAPPPQIS